MTQVDGGWLHGSSGMIGGDISGSYDSALVMLDGLAQPLLDPFVEGLKVRMLSYGPSTLWQRAGSASQHFRPPKQNPMVALLL